MLKTNIFSPVVMFFDITAERLIYHSNLLNLLEERNFHNESEILVLLLHRYVGYT